MRSRRLLCVPPALITRWMPSLNFAPGLYWMITSTCGPGACGAGGLAVRLVSLSLSSGESLRCPAHAGAAASSATHKAPITRCHLGNCLILINLWRPSGMAYLGVLCRPGAELVRLLQIDENKQVASESGLEIAKKCRE